jgi:hypothetical protein
MYDGILNIEISMLDGSVGYCEVQGAAAEA